MGESDEADWPEDDTELFGDETPEPKSEEEDIELSESSEDEVEEDTEAESEEPLEQVSEIFTEHATMEYLPIRAAPLLLQFHNETVTEYPLQQSADGRKTTSLVLDDDLLRIIDSRLDDDGQRRLKVSLSMKREITGFKHQHNELMHKHQFLWLGSVLLGIIFFLSSLSVLNLIGLLLATIGGWNWTKMHLETHHLQFSNSGGTLSHTLRGYGTNRPFFRTSMALLGSEMAGLLRNGTLETEALEQLHAALATPAPPPAPKPLPAPVQQPQPMAIEQPLPEQPPSDVSSVPAAPVPAAPVPAAPVPAAAPVSLPPPPQQQPNPPESTPMAGPPIVQIPPPPPTPIPTPLPLPSPPPPLGANVPMPLPPPLGLPAAPLPLDAPLPNAPEIAVTASPVEETLSEKEQSDLLNELS